MKTFLANLFSGLGKIWFQKTIAKQIRITLGLILIQVAIIIFFFPKLPPEIPLFFSQPWGKAQLAQPYLLIIFPVFSLVFLITNSLLATLFLEGEVLLSKILVFGSSLFTVFTLIALIKIIILVL